MVILTQNISIFLNNKPSTAVELAVKALQKDLKHIFDSNINTVEKILENQIRINRISGHVSETFFIETSSKTNSIIISASDDLGLIFGIYYLTEHILNIDPLYFWTDFEIEKRSVIEVQDFTYHQNPISPRFRGWFINDEDCLTAWDDKLYITEELWGIIFESLLRCGYNSVIPGTGTSPIDKQLDIAHSYGLWIAQHHAEPLGASMFIDVYPGITAKLPEELNRFKKLYSDAINSSKHRKTLWTVGFRGQGDRPFYEDDERYDTPEKRGELIRQMVDIQQEIVHELTEGKQFFLHYLYSESGELYRDGYLTLPDDVIRVYSDNGFGSMRIRRNLHERESGISSLPVERDSRYNSGVYYHVSFHDLEISNKLVPLVSPGIISKNLEPFKKSSYFDFFICNVSNIRPHVFQIDIIRYLWSAENIGDYINRWLQRHFPGFESRIKELLDKYYITPFSFNENYEDAIAGEQVYHHGLRRMIRGELKQESVLEWFNYTSEEFNTLEECYLWLLDRAEKSKENWILLMELVNEIESHIPEKMKNFFRDNIAMHIRYMGQSCLGFVSGVKAVLEYRKQQYKSAFIHFYQSRTSMLQALEFLLDSEHGKWKNFFRGDWLTGTRETIRYIDTIFSMCRIKGEDLIVNSDWMIEVMDLHDTAISIIPQANVSNFEIAKVLADSGIKRDRSILKSTNL